MWAVILTGALCLAAIGAAAISSSRSDGDDDASTRPVAPTTTTRANEPITTERAHTGVEQASACGSNQKLEDSNGDGWGICVSDTTTTTAPAFGTRANPLPVGLTMPGGNFDYQIVAYENTGVDALIHGFNQFNDPPAAGKITVRVRVKATYAGEGAGSAYSIQINLVGESGTTYGANNYVCCSDSADLLNDQPETFSGGAVEGWIYYQVSIEDAAGKFLAFDPNVNYTDVPGGVGFFAVN